MKATALFIAVASLCLFTSNSFAANDGPKTLVNPEWEFFDDFEGTVDNSFWAGNGVWVNYGVVRPDDATSRVLEMVYQPNSEGNGDSWSEYDFNIGIDAVQVEVSFKMFTPSNYVPVELNHKFFYLYSGPYGHANANIVVSAEATRGTLGAVPFLNPGVDIFNYGWFTNPAGTGGVLWETNAGSWSTYQIFFELATEAGDFGFYEIYKDGELVISTDSDLSEGWEHGVPSDESLFYSTNGNFLDKGTLLGWANGAPNGGFLVDTKFLIDDFRIRANSEFGAVEVVPEVLGDFDDDGDADGADFLLWQRDPTVGSLSDWENNFGTISAISAAASVPEPVSGVVAASSILMAALLGPFVTRSRFFSNRSQANKK